MKKNLRYYLLQYPAWTGMGSDTDTYLVTEENLRRLIEIELEKKRSGDRFASERLTGTWVKEVFCDSADPEEVIADVMQKRMSSCSTYAGCNDLIPLPDDCCIRVQEEHYERTIFRLFNQWGFKRDIIVGEGVFYRHFVDFRDDDPEECRERFGLHGSGWHEFTSYQLWKVAECHYFDIFGGLEGLLKVESDKITRLENKKKGTPIKHKGAYIDDLLEGCDLDKWDQKLISEANATIRKFKTFLEKEPAKDKYLSHLYDGHYDPEGYPGWLLEETGEEDKETDHVKGLYYDYPIAPDNLGLIRKDHTDGDLSHVLTYDELFLRGDDFETLIADHVSSYDNPEDWKYMNAALVLRNFFGYD